VHNGGEFLKSTIVSIQVNFRSHNCLVVQSFAPALAFRPTREAPMPGLYFHLIDDENYPESTKVALFIEGALVLAILALSGALIGLLA
jgi:hypothetical protein